MTARRAPASPVLSPGLERASSSTMPSAAAGIARATARLRSLSLFRTAIYGIDILLLCSLLGVLCGSAWEYSTQRYLRGFSDAIVPLSDSPERKVQAILHWMSHAPARVQQAPSSMGDDRDPTDTLNYESLLQVCGTATNAFINLADSSGLTARRLLLLDTDRNTVHVVAEVLIDSRWIVVDPTFHTVFRGPDGAALTAQQLAVPAIFHAATQQIHGYDASYVFNRTTHIHFARLGSAGGVLQLILKAANWEGSPTLSLILERESLETALLFAFFAVFLFVLRAAVRWYGKARFGVRPAHIRDRLRQIASLLLEPPEKAAHKLQ